MSSQMDLQRELLGEDMAEDISGPLADVSQALQPNEKLVDADFFNAFDDDFNEQDMIPQQ